MHDTFKMAKIQPCYLGSGDGRNSSHGKRMHQYFLTRIRFLTQRRTNKFAQKVATCYYESFAIDTAVECASDQLMDLVNIDKHWKEEDNDDVEDGIESKLEWNHQDEDIPMESDLTKKRVCTSQLQFHLRPGIKIDSMR